MGMEEWKKLRMDRSVPERDDRQIMNSENLLNNYFQAWTMAQEVKAAMPDDQRFMSLPELTRRKREVVPQIVLWPSHVNHGTYEHIQRERVNQ